MHFKRSCKKISNWIISAAEGFLRMAMRRIKCTDSSSFFPFQYCFGTDTRRVFQDGDYWSLLYDGLDALESGSSCSRVVKE